MWRETLVGHVARDIRLGKLEHFHKLANAEFSFQKETENPEARLIGESLEEPCYFFHVHPHVPVKESGPYRDKAAMGLVTTAPKPASHRVTYLLFS
jgi:hypothetical protein